MTLLRSPVLALMLSLLFALTGQSMASVRGMSAATGQMVLCVGSGSVTVYTDKAGQPTSAPHICPECLPSLVAVTVPPSALQGVAEVSFPVTVTAQARVVALAVLRHYSVRGPPVFA